MPKVAHIVPDVGSPAERYERLAAIDLGGGARPDETASLIVDAAVELLYADAGAAVLLWDTPESRGRVAACSLSFDARHLPSSAPVAAVAATGEDWFATGAYAGQSGILAGSVAAVPLHDDRVRGVLVVARDDPDGLETDGEFLRLFAERSAAALSTSSRLSSLEANRERFEVLAWVANALIAVDDLREVLGAVVEGAAAALLADHVLLVVESPSGSPTVVTGGLDGTRPAVPDSVLAEGIGSWVVGEGRVATLPGGITDGREGTPSLRRLIGCADGPAIAAPVVVGDANLGMLAAFRPDGAADFEEAEVDLVIAVAGQAAAAIDNVRLAEERARSLASTTALYEVAQKLNASQGESELLQAGADGAIAALPAAGAVFATVDVTGRVLGNVAAAGGPAGVPEHFDEMWDTPAGRVLRTGAPLRHDTAQGGGWVAAPLKVHGRVLGVAWAVRDPDQDRFGDEEVRLLASLASQVALSIDNVRHMEAMQLLADTDDLTDLLNRRTFDERADLAFRTAVRLGTPVSVMMFDVDHFKRVNDTHGHAVGDQVLAAIARSARDALRDVDILGRYGGEEFAAVLPAADGDAAVIIAERLRRTVAAVAVEAERGAVSVKLSVGVAARIDEMEMQPVLERADAALYRAKANGRDRVESG